MRISCFAILLLIAGALYSAPKQPQASVDLWGQKTALSFEPNQGQTASEVRYVARTSSGVLFFTNREIVLDQGTATVRFELLGADRNAAWDAIDPSGATTSYYVGRDRSKWAQAVPHYRRLARRQVYSGIDVIYYGKDNRLEYDFVLAPHTDPSRIRIRAIGARQISIGGDGALLVDTAAGQVIQHKPSIYQVLGDGSKRSVNGSFRLLAENEVGFKVGAHDRDLTLYIDPVLESSTYFGGSGDDKIVAATANGTIVGTTTSIDFPGASFARRHGADIFVQSLSRGSQALVLGGSGDDQVTSAAFSNDFGNIIVGGYTNSQDLPTGTLNPYSRQNYPPWQANFAGGATDGFMLILSQVSGRLVPFVSYVGTPGDDKITAVAADRFSSGFAFVGTTNGTGLPIPIFSNVPVQSNPAGGLDGFLMDGNASNYDAPYLATSTYIGGSGDDTPLSISFAPTGAGYYIAGETTSPDFPLVKPIYSQRSGNSDAFLMYLSTRTIYASTLVGGSGSDRIVSIAPFAQFGTPNVMVAGVTSSADLPLANPVQASYGGGPSDAFLAQFSYDLSKMISCTYYGGSGADESTSVAADFLGNIFLGGWTSSTDFPVKNALQPAYGGGPDDGFLVHFDTDGSVYQATYFGGSGSDRIQSVAAPGGPTVVVAGGTTSPDLPLQNATQTTLRGASDGFIATISETTLNVGSAIGGKDLRLSVSVYAGNSTAASSMRLTVTSGNPSVVQLAANSFDPGQSSTQIQFAPAPTPAYQNFYMDCLDVQGGADLTLSLVGYPDKIVHAKCVETHIFIPAANPTAVQLWSQPLDFYVDLIALDPNNPSQNGYYAGLRPGAAPITIQVGSSNPAVGTLSGVPVTITANPNTTPRITFTPTSIGSTELTFSSASLKSGPYDQLQINVTPPVQFYNPSTNIPVGFQTGLSWKQGGYPPDKTVAVTFTSQDPSKVVLSIDPSQAGSATLSLPYSQLLTYPTAVYAQVLAAGDTTITVSIPGTPDVTTLIHSAPPVAGLYPPNPISLAVGDFASPGVATGLQDNPAILSIYLPNPGVVPQFTLTSSDPTVVAVTTDTVHLKPAYNSRYFQAVGVAAGTATLTLHVPDGIGLASAATLPITVAAKRPPHIGDLEVGKDLTGIMTLSVPATMPKGTIVTLTSGNPALALLSTDGKTGGQAQIAVTIPSASDALTFYVYGLASSGQSKITAQITGFAPLTATVQLDPSGFGWSSDQYTTILYSNTPGSGSISSFVLDPASMLPVGTQALRPGVTVAVAIQNSNPGVISISPATLTFPILYPSSPDITIKALAVGNATLSIAQPPGFSTPSVRQQFPVIVTAPPLLMTPLNLGKNSQTTLGFQGQIGPVSSLPLTITSSDPSKLVVSADRTVLGSGSITVTGAQSRGIYLQALDGQGIVTVTASMPNFIDGTVPVTLRGSGFVLSPQVDPNGGSTTNANGIYNTTTESPRTHLNLGLVTVDTSTGQTISGNVSLLPGLSGLQVEVRSSNTAVGQIAGSPATVTINPNQTPGVDFQPTGAGSTDVAVVQPPGFTAPVSGTTVKFVVTPPGFVHSDLVFAKDTFAPTDAGLPQNVSPPTTNVSVTITSSDPSRVLLSPDANTLPTPSIKTVLVAGQRSVGRYYIHALGNNGIVPISITAPGFADSSINVALTDLQFGFSTNSANGIGTVLQAGPQQLRIAAEIVFLKNLPGTYGAFGVTIRPGLPDLIVTVASSNPGVVTIDNPQVVFKAGSTSGVFTYRPVAPGQTILSLNPPNGYLVDPSFGQIAMTVANAKLNFLASAQIGRDLQIYARIAAEVPLPSGTPLTVTSSDPSLLLVAPDASTPGQPSITVTSVSGMQAAVYLQSLSDSGSVSVSVSADGYQTATGAMTLAPSAAVFQTSQTSLNVFTNAGVQKLAVLLDVLDPLTLQTLGPQAARPGANLSVTVSSSDANVMGVNTPTLNFDSSGNAAIALLQPRGVGTAIVSLGLLPGGVTPASGAQIAFNVTEPDLSIPDFSLGRDLQVPVQVALASRLPAPTADLTVNVSDNNDFHAALTNSPTVGPPQSSISTVIPAGQRVSKPFYVQTNYSSGTALLTVSAGSPYTSTPNTVTSTGTAFVFKEATQSQPVSLTAGSQATLNAIPVLFPFSTPFAPLTIRAGAPPITVNVVSSAPNVLVVRTPVLTFIGGDQQQPITVQAIAPGTATLTLSGATYEFGSSQSSLALTVK